MSMKLNLTAADLELKFPVFTEDTPPPRLTMDEYYHLVCMTHEMRSARSAALKETPVPNPCPVRFKLEA